MSFDFQSLDIPSLLNLAAQSASLVFRSLFPRTEDNFPLDRPRRGREKDMMVMMMMMHTAPESVKRVKSIKQILVKNKMEAERLSQC